MRAFIRLCRDRSAASGAEFALVLPLLLMFLFGMIDVGRFMWEYNEAEKATQMGVRYAVATDMLPGQAFANYSFAISGGLPQGSTVPTSAFDKVVCTQSSCTCTGGAVCATVQPPNATVFNRLAGRMKAMYGPINPANVQVEYRNIGLGYAGDPNGPDVAPLVTVRLQGLTFGPLTCMYFLCDINMPAFRASLTLEDGNGAVAN